MIMKCKICSRQLAPHNHSGVCSGCRDSYRNPQRLRAEQVCRELGIPLDNDAELAAWVATNLRDEQSGRSVA
jgi:hypothetical protein